MPVAPLVEPHRGDAAGTHQQRRQQHQVPVPQMADRQRGQQRARQPAEAGAAGDQCEQALGLAAGQDVGQYAPGQGDQQQVDHRHPDVEAARQPHVVRPRQQGQAERQQAGDDRTEHPRQDPPARHLRRDPAEQRQYDQRGQEGAGEEPLQVVHAPGDAHRFADRPEHEVAGEQQEEHQQAGAHYRGLVGCDVEQAGQQARQRAARGRS